MPAMCGGGRWGGKGGIEFIPCGGNGGMPGGGPCMLGGKGGAKGGGPPCGKPPCGGNGGRPVRQLRDSRGVGGAYWERLGS